MVSLDSIVAGLQILGGAGVALVMAIDLFVIDPNPSIHVPHIVLGIVGCLLAKWTIVSLLFYLYFPWASLHATVTPAWATRRWRLSHVSSAGWLGSDCSSLSAAQRMTRRMRRIMRRTKSGKKSQTKDK
mmetsp:Transcript_61302/g.190014  ORF Transcript_61302/g.190014 Transcript_61302/m.190014 type:complete len:129 (+) Transcript_61302:71-457(+)